MDPELAQALIDLHSRDRDVRERAVSVLREKLEIPEAAHALHSALFDRDGHIIILAAEALSVAKLYCDSALPVLIAVVEVGDKASIAEIPHAKEWRSLAAGAIGNYESAAVYAIPALRNALLDPDANVRACAAVSLARIGPEAIVALQDLRLARQAETDTSIREVFETAIEHMTEPIKFVVICPDNEKSNLEEKE